MNLNIKFSKEDNGKILVVDQDGIEHDVTEQVMSVVDDYLDFKIDLRFNV